MYAYFKIPRRHRCAIAITARGSQIPANRKQQRLRVTERSCYGDLRAQGHPAKTVRRCEYEPNHAHLMNLGQVLKQVMNYWRCFEHTAALMGIAVHTLARSESVSESKKSVVRCSRSCGYLTITAITITCNILLLQ